MPLSLRFQIGTILVTYVLGFGLFVYAQRVDQTTNTRASHNSVTAPKMLWDSAGKEHPVDWGFNGEVSGSIVGIQTFDALAHNAKH